LTLVLAAVALAGGCGTEPLPPATIAITPEDLVLTEAEPGVTEKLLAVIEDERGRAIEDVQVSWSSSDTSVATVEGVDPRALMTVVGNGSTVLSAVVGTLEAQATVTVRISNRWVLLQVYSALGGDDWVQNTNWGSYKPLDRWHGVSTDFSGDVVGLLLSSNGLSGPIPSELGNLENLQALLLSSNDLSGPIPSELGNLESLEYLMIDNTLLSGRLPRELIGVSLGYFHWNETDLCSPADEEFRRWLKSIFDHRENRECSS